jgi:hypothetical protein
MGKYLFRIIGLYGKFSLGFDWFAAGDGVVSPLEPRA